MRVLLAVLALVAVLGEQYADARALLQKRIPPHRMIRGRKPHGLVPKPNRPANPTARVMDQPFLQRVDHFDPHNKMVFIQRYWCNDMWYRPGGPQFLMIGGESVEDSMWVDNDEYPWTSLAKEVGAMVFLLEHRFYGGSQPTGDLKHKSLKKYLNSEQALADINHFILGQNKEFNFTNPRWITFGGSYAGSLAAWARQKYPDTIYAAVASSAPVQAVVDFTSYLDVVYMALYHYNPKCADSVHNGFLQINEFIKTWFGRAILNFKFNLCLDLTDLTKADNTTIHTFYDILIGYYAGIVLYSEDNTAVYDSQWTIPQLCKHQLGAASDLDGILAINEWLGDGDCLDVNYQITIDSIKHADVYDKWADYRAWIWQTCNEFGWFHSTDSIFVKYKFTGADVPVDYYIQQCADIFGAGFSNTTVYHNVDKTNAHYHGQNGYNGTRVFFSHGTNDPWHPLGLLKATNDQVYPRVIAGTSHCADMYPPAFNEKPGLIAVRKAIQNAVYKWVHA